MANLAANIYDSSKQELYLPLNIKVNNILEINNDNIIIPDLTSKLRTKVCTNFCNKVGNCSSCTDTCPQVCADNKIECINEAKEANGRGSKRTGAIWQCKLNNGFCCQYAPTDKNYCNIYS